MRPAFDPQPTATSAPLRQNIFDVPAPAPPTSGEGTRVGSATERRHLNVAAYGARVLTVAIFVGALAALVLIAEALLTRSHDENTARLAPSLAIHPEPPALPRVTEDVQRRAPRPRRGRRPKRRVARRPHR